MALASEQRRHVAELRAQARAYLSDIRDRRRRKPEDPPDDAAPETAAPAVKAAPLAPCAQVAALALQPPPPPPRPALKRLPLAALSRLGPGMIWRLNQIGVHSLDELAAADPARLADTLGPIGRLLRCDLWVQSARDILAER